MIIWLENDKKYVDVIERNKIQEKLDKYNCLDYISANDILKEIEEILELEEEM